MIIPMRFILLFSLCVTGFAFALDQGENTDYDLVKSKHFQNLFIKKGADLTRYKKVMFFPVNDEKISIASRAGNDIRRNWRDFKSEDFQDFIPVATELTHKAFVKGKHFMLHDAADEETLAFQVQFLEIYPVAFLDNSLNTAGNEYVHQFAAAQFRIVIMDTASKEMIAMIHDTLQVVQRNQVRNNRAAHRRAWKESFKEMISDFEMELTALTGVDKK